MKGIPAEKPYQDYRLYKIFHKREGRFYAVLVKPGHRTTISLAKYILEVHLGRRLQHGFHAHHKDDCKTNDVPRNLEEKMGSEHSRQHNLKKGRKYAVLDCPRCGREFRKEFRQTHFIKKNGQTLTFCSRACTGGKPLTGKTQAVKRFERVYASVPQSVEGPAHNR